MIKKSLLALAALGVCGSAFAGSAGDEVLPPAPVEVNVTVPQQQGGWAFGVEAYWQSFENSDFQYANVLDNPANSNSFASKIKSVDPDHDWGGHVDVSYLFAGNASDITLGYTRLHTDDSNKVNTSNGNQLNGGQPQIIVPGPQGPNQTNWDNARGKQDNELDVVDLTAGRQIQVGSRVRLHPFAGLRYADIEQDNRAHYNRLNADDGFDTLDGKNDSEFEGIGPRFGMDANFELGMGFSLTGRMAGSLLVGNFEDKGSSTQVTGGNALLTTASTKVDDTMRVVPELDARLGVRYDHDFNPDVAMGAELGYEVENYFDAVGNSGFGYVDTVNHNSDLGRRGPYLRVDLKVA